MACIPMPDSLLQEAHFRLVWFNYSYPVGDGGYVAITKLNKTMKRVACIPVCAHMRVILFSVTKLIFVFTTVCVGVCESCCKI